MSLNLRRTSGRPGRIRPWACALALLLPIGWTLSAPACETTPRKPTTIKKVKKKHTTTTTTTKKPPTTTPTKPITPLPEKVTDNPTPPKPPITTVTPSTPTTPTQPGTVSPGTVTPVPSPEHVTPIPEPSSALIGLGLIGAVAVAMRTRQRSR